jgi:hypothetical protein
MNHVFQILNSLAITVSHISGMVPWDLVAASGVLSPVLLAVKQPLKKRIESDKTMEKVMMSLVIIFGIVVATLQYLVNVPTTDPSIIAVHGLLISAMSQPFYMILVKPFYRWLSGELAKAKAFDAEVKSAAIPATGLPTGTTQP